MMRDLWKHEDLGVKNTRYISCVMEAYSLTNLFEITTLCSGKLNEFTLTKYLARKSLMQRMDHSSRKFGVWQIMQLPRVATEGCLKSFTASKKSM